MQLNRAMRSFVYALADHRVQSQRSAPIGHDVIERAAEALYEFVFSGCDRLDRKRRWADCDEETRAGFRREVTAVLEAALPMLLPRENQIADRALARLR